MSTATFPEHLRDPLELATDASEFYAAHETAGYRALDRRWGHKRSIMDATCTERSPWWWVKDSDYRGTGLTQR